MTIDMHRLWTAALWCSVAAGVLMQLVMLGSPFVGDEGSNEQVVHRIAGEGRYASQDLGTPHQPGKARGLDFDGYITTGPTVLAPAGLVNRIFGRGAVQTRSVMLLYYLLGVWFFYAFVRRLFDRTTAAVAGSIFATCPLVLEAGHRLLGEMAALCFIFAGLLMVLRYAEENRFRWLVPAALLLGLAGVSKVLAFLGVFGVAIWLCWKGTRGVAARLTVAAGFCLIAALPMLLWFAVMIGTIGWESFSHNYLGYTLGFFGGDRGGGGFGFLLKLLPKLSWITWVANNGPLAILGALASLHFLQRREKRSVDFLLITMTLVTFWFANGMHRYSLYFTSFLICIIARYVTDLAGSEILDLRNLRRGSTIISLACLALVAVNMLYDIRFIYLGEPGHEYWFAVTYHSLRHPFWEMF